MATKSLLFRLAQAPADTPPLHASQTACCSQQVIAIRLDKVSADFLCKCTECMHADLFIPAV